MTVIQQEQEALLLIPDWVRDLESFRRWAKSDEFPSRGWYAHLDGQLWVDPSLERAAHNRLKTKFSTVLAPLVDGARSGYFFGDRMLLTNEGAGLSTEPDGMYVSYSAVREQRARLQEGADSLEVQGTPDMVLEIISPTSVNKDSVVLRDLYWRSGIAEYWLADSRADSLAFDIFRRGTKGYASVRKQAGWVRSSVFGKSFRLAGRDDELGMPIYALEFR